MIPALRRGEKGTADLFQTQDQPFNLAGETGIDYAARQRAAEAVAEREHSDALEADKTQLKLNMNEIDRITEGRTIWNSDGSKPCLICAPPTVAQLKGSSSEETVTRLVGKLDRNGVIKAIKTALQKRSGKAWSVTGGRGTAWGWIHIDAPPARQTWTSVPKPHNPGGHLPGVENWDNIDTGKPGGHTSPADRAELAKLLGVDLVQTSGGVGVPSSSDYYREYLHRAMFGHPGSFNAKPYWD